MPCGCSNSSTNLSIKPSVGVGRIAVREKVLCEVQNFSDEFQVLHGPKTGKCYTKKRNGSQVLVDKRDYHAAKHLFRLVEQAKTCLWVDQMHCDLIEIQYGHKFRYRCIRCNQTSAPLSRQSKFLMPCLKHGLGDRIEQFLRFIGIRWFCEGCKSRKRFLNNLDRKLYRYFKGPKDATYLD